MVLTRTVNNFENINSGIGKKCFFCNGNHLCRQCPLETFLAPLLKKYIGSVMENYISDNYFCPSCNQKKMNVLGNHSPSLDIICKNCNRKFEVKSKCLSVNELPKDLNFPHGNFSDYKKRQNLGLDFFFIIYKVDRIKKKLFIREVLYAKNNAIREFNNIKIVQRNNSNLSTILIKDKDKLKKFPLNKNIEFDFSGIVKKYSGNLIENEKSCEAKNCFSV